MALFRLFVWRYFVFFSRYFVFSHGHAKRRQDEITPSEKTKKRFAKRRKDEKTPREKTTKLKFQMVSLRMAFLSSFHEAGFVFSHGVISSFFLSFRMASKD